MQSMAPDEKRRETTADNLLNVLKTSRVKAKNLHR